MNAPASKVLIIDDEPPIRKLLRMGLTTQGYQIIEAPNGKTALELLKEEPDLIILDLGLPDIQGHELLRMIRVRNESVPIVVLSSRGDEAGKVQALDYGADDYVTKPFGMDELLARMRAALRHQLQAQGERPIFKVGDLSVDLVRRIVKMDEREAKLSPKEYDLLRVLVQHAGKVLTHKFLLGELWDSMTDAQYLRVYVRQLRQKIEKDPERPQYADRNRDRLSASLTRLTPTIIACDRKTIWKAQCNLPIISRRKTLSWTSRRQPKPVC
jgi:two-component system KDP operon response regulator KdpE